jgi:hypothetical protein
MARFTLTGCDLRPFRRWTTISATGKTARLADDSAFSCRDAIGLRCFTGSSARFDVIHEELYPEQEKAPLRSSTLIYEYVRSNPPLSVLLLQLCAGVSMSESE